MDKKWLVNKTNPEFLEYLSKKTSVSPLCAQILVNRGIRDVESIKSFLSPSLEALHDPFLMPDMKQAVERIRTAREKGETVLVCGDYDADGLTATTLLVSVLRDLGITTHFHIPNRIDDGYGLKSKGVQIAHTIGARLLITVDCGISSDEEVLMANSLGIDVIITDHHEPPPRIPLATAVINPHRTDSAYPFKNLAGVGVAYKLCQALSVVLPLSNSPSAQTQGLPMTDALGLVSVGTVADSVPLTGENRILVTFGLKSLNLTPSMPWVSALKEISGIKNKDLNSTSLAYGIIPRINAVGRLGDAGMVVDFFLTKDMEKAKKIASFIEARNRERQKIEEEVYVSALRMIEREKQEYSLVLSSPEWHPGVTGIVASRLAEMFYMPAFLFSVKGNTAKGSGRSIRPFHIYQGVCECADHLLGFGGHNQAVGLSIHTDKITEFKYRISAIVKNALSSDDMVPTIEIDASIDLCEINFNLVREINLLEPFGNSNQRPVMGTRGVEFFDVKLTGNKHLKAKSRQKSVAIDTIGFSMADSLEKIDNSLTFDIIFVPCINEWNGSRTLQLNLKALRPSLQ